MAMRGKCIIPWCQGFRPVVLSYSKSLHKPISTIHLLQAFWVKSWMSLVSSWQSDWAIQSWWLFGGGKEPSWWMMLMGVIAIVFLSFHLPLCLSSWWERLGRRGRGSISSQAEPGSCHHRDSCHANTPTTIIGALMGLSLTWERGRKGEGGEAPRGKECAEGDM